MIAQNLQILAAKVVCPCGARLWWRERDRWWTSDPTGGSPGVREDMTPGTPVPLQCPDCRGGR